ncbi:class I SAM-dependent methyltransferase [Cohnella yongneupensis]|uniref:Class I SAM-dependent methyltransferase n=1 Tax=Cohnella yongneupensis TaxID=425006 RepID=A0ABW0R568_9BACL
MDTNRDYPRLLVGELFGAVERIEGWLTHLEQMALLHLPLFVDHLSGDIVEIGSFKGKSTVSLGLGSKWLSGQKRKVYAIDPFMPDVWHYRAPYFEDFKRNIQSSGLEDYVIPINKPSYEALDQCPERICGLFVDGDHSYIGVKRDIQLYTPRVIDGGMVAFHDYSVYADVARAVDELCDSGDYVYVGDYDSLRLLRKIKK